MLRADVTSRYTAARIALGGAAFVSVNEVRAGENLPPADPDATGADAITRPVNMATLGSDATGTAPDGAGHPAAAEGGVPGADNVASPPKKPNASEAAQADSETANSIDRSAALLERLGLSVDLVAHKIDNPPPPPPITVVVNMDPKEKTKTIHTRRDLQGNLFATVVETSERGEQTRTVTTARDAEGNLIAKVVETPHHG